eukprot:768349-Hanusia_phi.AAC.2
MSWKAASAHATQYVRAASGAKEQDRRDLKNVVDEVEVNCVGCLDVVQASLPNKLQEEAHAVGNGYLRHAASPTEN